MALSSWTQRLGLILATTIVASGCATAESTATSAPTQTEAATVTATGSVAPATFSLKVPSKPVTINVLDVAGNLQLTKQMMENFKAAHPEIIANITYSTSTAPELAGKLQAQQAAGNAQISLVMTGTDGISAGIKNDLLTKITPDHNDMFPGLMDNYLAPAADMQGLAQGYGIGVVYYPSGPLYEYNPSKVTTTPTSPAELLAWAKAHPGKFEYARPANSGPGRTFLMALPYLLGDKDPKDPTNGWDKTWAYLKDLGQYINVYQTGTTATMKDLAAGTVDMVASTTGWYINPIILGTVPKTTAVGRFDNMTWVTDMQYAVIPKGVDADTLTADLDLIAWMLKPDQQAISYDKGYFYPGPAIKNVTIDMAPADSQAALKDVVPSQFEQWIAQFPKATSLPADQQVIAFDLWDRNVGKK
ncbi:MAG TPA: extracellular solute-binding protein [Candidatus Limnocylindrales bacterium]